jgi:AraC-like DNA-binding protein
MDPVSKALWYIESHFGDSLTVDDVTAASGVTRHHLARAFGCATGHSVMRYVRGRRLTEAARALAAASITSRGSRCRISRSCRRTMRASVWRRRPMR